MSKPQYPDHAGRMPGHPRYGNPSDEAEESARVGKAFQNLEDWQKRNGEFSGGVTMQYGNGPVYKVGIGRPEIAQKIVSRPISADVNKKQIELQKSPVEPITLEIKAEVGLFRKFLNWITRDKP